MIIYKSTNLINNKIYIGKTINRLEIRIKEHRIYSNKDTDIFFYKAIRKYGFENFKWEIIENCISNKDELAAREIYWIRYYNSNKIGYNMTLGGEGGDTLSNHPNKVEIFKRIVYKNTGLKRSVLTKNKMSRIHKGKVITQEHRDSISKKLKGKTRTPFTKEHRDNISKSKIGYKHSDDFKNNRSKKYIGAGNPNYNKLDNNIIDKIIKLYTLDKKTITDISNITNIFHKKIRKTLVENNIEICKKNKRDA